MSNVFVAAIGVIGTLAGGILVALLQRNMERLKLDESKEADRRARFLAAAERLAADIGEYRRAELNRSYQFLLDGHDPRDRNELEAKEVVSAVRALRTRAWNSLNALRLITSDKDILEYADRLIDQAVNLKNEKTTAELEAHADNITRGIIELVGRCRVYVWK